jgi:hypothetical protein
MVEKVANVAPAQKPVAAAEPITAGEGKSKWWLWVIIAVVIIGVVAALLILI